MAPRLTLIAILAAASAAALLWGLRAPPGEHAAGAVRPGGAAGAGDPVAAVPAAGTVATDATPPAAPQPRADAAAGTVPPGLTPAQWATVEAGLATHPQPEAERQRLWRYFAWSDAVQRWRAARHDAALARQVDAGLAERLARAEVSGPEARQLKAALLQTLEPDEAARTAAMRAFDAGLPAPSGPSAHELAFQQRQAAVVAAWQARPAAQRDPAALTRELEALRRTHFQKETTR